MLLPLEPDGAKLENTLINTSAITTHSSRFLASSFKIVVLDQVGPDRLVVALHCFDDQYKRSVIDGRPRRRVCFSGTPAAPQQIHLAAGISRSVWLARGYLVEALFHIGEQLVKALALEHLDQQMPARRQDVIAQCQR